MSKEVLKSLIDMIDDNDIETIFRVLIRFVPEAELCRTKSKQLRLQTEVLQQREQSHTRRLTGTRRIEKGLLFRETFFFKYR